MSIRRCLVVAVLAIVTCGPSFDRSARAQQKKVDVAETVMVTFHAKRGAEADLARVIARHWETVRRQNLVREAPHVTVRGTEGADLSYFIEIFTWRDASIPDAAPPEIQTIWAEMNKLVEARNGRPGIDIVEVSLVEP